jgi:PAS domain S-box-containing protein
MPMPNETAPDPEFEPKGDDERELLQLMVQAVTDYGIFRLDPDGYVSSWNDGARRIKGYEEADILGRHFSVFYPPEAVETGWPDHELRVAGREGRFEDEGWRLRKDGSRFWANVVITAIYHEDGRLLGFTKVTRDLTERREHEERLRQAKRRLDRANRELTVKNRHLEEFARVASHDLQEPIRRVRSFTDLLVDEMGDAMSDDAEMYVARMRASLERMSTLVRNLLRYAHSMTEDHQFEHVDLDSVLDDVLTDLQPRIETTGGTVSRDPLPSIDGDPTLLHQLFLNIVGNALKFHRPDTPPIVLVQSELMEQERCVRIRISDNGIGFSEHEASTLFKPFMRLHSSSEYEGTGLGLSICQRIAELHRGAIDASRSSNEGAVFTITLPLDQQ